MSWTDIEERIAAKSRYDASVRLYARKASSKPALIISLRSLIMSGLKWKPADTFGLALGSGDVAGKVRIIRRKEKAIATPRQMKTGAFSFDFGHVAQLGDRGTLKAEAVAVVIDKDTVEVTIPKFEYDDEQEDEPEREAGSTPRGPAAAPPPRPAVAGPSRTGEPSVNMNGIIVEFYKDVECIRYRGKTADLTLRQALFAGACVKAMPNPVNRGFLINKIFGLRPPSTAEMVLDQISLDLGKLLPDVGLRLKNQKGVGFAIEAA